MAEIAMAGTGGGGEISIQIDEFDSKIANLRSALSSINSSIKLGREFEQTNIAPFVDDLETTLDAIKLLEKYKQMLNNDTNTLDRVGQDMVENDEHLGRMSGPQTLHA